jgi:HAE1 family hydrophobic/amphiphilic exporter-1
MTLICTVLSGLPLILGSGPGAEARASIGWVIVGGLGLAAVFTLFLTPAAYALISGLTRARAASGQALEAELREVEKAKRLTHLPSPYSRNALAK